MKTKFYAAIMAAVFFGVAVTNASANQVKKSKSNVSNNRASAADTLRDHDSDGDGVPTAAAKVNATAGEVCDDGNGNAEDCHKAKKDYTTDPYVETTQRDHASGLPTGKRMHKPMAVTQETDKSATSTTDGGSAAVQTATSASAEKLCPGSPNCPPSDVSVPAGKGAGVISDPRGKGTIRNDDLK